MQGLARFSDLRSEVPFLGSSLPRSRSSSSTSLPGIAELTDLSQALFLEMAAPFLAGHPHAKRGFCNGLAFLWAHFKAQGKGQWFFEQYAAFLLQETGPELSGDADRFIRLLKFFQWSGFLDMTWIAQTDFASLVNSCNAKDEPKVEQEYKLGFNFSKKELEKVLALLPIDNKMVFLTSPNHTIAIMKLEGEYQIYDANTGAEVYRKKEANAVDYIFSCFGLKEDDTYLPLNIQAIRQVTQEPTAYPVPAAIINDLLKTDPNIERINPTWPGHSAFRMAAAYNAVESARTLLSHGADINKEYDGFTAVEHAASLGHVDMVQMLVRAGADINQALFQAAAKGYEDMLNALIEQGADVNYKKSGYSALDIAASRNQLETVKILVAAGAWSDSAIGFAQDKEHTEVGDYLRSAQGHRKPAFAAAAAASTAKAEPEAAGTGIAPPYGNMG